MVHALMKQSGNLLSQWARILRREEESKESSMLNYQVVGRGSSLTLKQIKTYFPSKVNLAGERETYSHLKTDVL